MGSFLIRLGDSFLSYWEEGETPLWHDVPSQAAHLDYQTADEICQALRALGFHCYVTDCYGDEADVDCIRRNGHRYDDEEIEEMYQKEMAKVAEVSAPVEGNER
jgi:hypothetical protein